VAHSYLMLLGLFYVVALVLLVILRELFVDESYPPPWFRDSDSGLPIDVRRMPRASINPVTRPAASLECA
jgi:hypothetical protein